MTDPDRFLALLEELRQSLTVLDRYRREVTRERLLSDVDTQNMVLFALYRAVQGAIDIGQHVIAERGMRVPSAYREIFRVLEMPGPSTAISRRASRVGAGCETSSRTSTASSIWL